MQADNMLTNRKFGFCWQGRLDHEGHRSSLVWERMPSRPRPGDRFRSRWECGCESRAPVAARVRGAELPPTDPRMTADSPPSFACYRRHRQRRQSTALTKKKRRDFLQALADGMSVTSAAAYAGLSRRYMYEIKDMVLSSQQRGMIQSNRPLIGRKMQSAVERLKARLSRSGIGAKLSAMYRRPRIS